MPDISDIRARIASGSKRDAQRELAHLLKEQPSNIDAWLLMAQVVDDVQKKADCYNKVLTIDPDNVQANDRLGWLYSQPALTPEFEPKSGNETKEKYKLEEVLEPVGGLTLLAPPVKKKRKGKQKSKPWIMLSAMGLVLGITAILVITTLPSPLRTSVQTTPTKSDLAHNAVETPAGPIPADIDPGAEIPGVRVIYVKDQQLWQWSNGESSSISPTGADITHIEISPDGERTALIRDGNLWLLSSRGGNAKQIVYSALLPRDELSGQAPSRKVCHPQWSMDSTVIFFNTCSTNKQYYDLFFVRVSTTEVTALLQDGQGGMAYPSPDSQWVVSVAPEEIHLTNMTNKQTSTVFLYDKVLGEGVQWLPPIAWNEDSEYFLAAIPPVSDKNDPDIPTRLWMIPVDGTSKELAGEFYPQRNDITLSPNANSVLFFHVSPSRTESEWHLYDVSAKSDRILTEEAAPPFCWDRGGIQFAAFSPNLPPTLLVGKIPDGTVSESQTGLSGSFKIERAVCLGNGYLLVSGTDGDHSSVWVIGNDIKPILIYDLPAGQQPVYEPVR